ncbi:MAG: serine protease, partial [Planctomycetota bacterium]
MTHALQVILLLGTIVAVSILPGAAPLQAQGLGGVDSDAPQTLLQIQQQVQRRADALIAATVAVRVGTNEASGVIVTADGHVLTAAHVAGGSGRNAVITLRDGTELAGKTLGLNSDVDGALAKIDQEGEWVHAPIASDQAMIQTGQWCIATGHPGGLDLDRPPPLR